MGPIEWVLYGSCMGPVEAPMAPLLRHAAPHVSASHPETE